MSCTARPRAGGDDGGRSADVLGGAGRPATSVSLGTAVPAGSCGPRLSRASAASSATATAAASQPRALALTM
jgi:hypothetical protein